MRRLCLSPKGPNLDRTSVSCYPLITSPVVSATGCEAAFGRPLRVYCRTREELMSGLAGSSPVPLRAFVYIDGFNLYHGCFDNFQNRSHWRQYRWLDLDAFCRKIFPHYSIQGIRYFTALVDPFLTNPDNRTRQLTYLRALDTIPHLTIHQGRFATNAKDRPVADPNMRKPTPLVPLRMAHVIEREEKGSGCQFGKLSSRRRI